MDSQPPSPDSPRLLIIDDNRAIHADFRKVLIPAESTAALDALEEQLFGEVRAESEAPSFLVDSAYQGREGLEKVSAAHQRGRPYAVAFVDMRMPPGWDGLETIQHLWEVDPALQIVICTAYSDHSWQDILRKLGQRDGLLILKKPFDGIEVSQMAQALTQKWTLRRALDARLAQLETLVGERTHELERANERLQQEMRARSQMEIELRLAQKLEAVGRIAAGVAHELNTPIQFVSDSTHFVREGLADLLKLLEVYAELALAAGRGAPTADLLAEVRGLAEEIDLPYLIANAPVALDRCVEGLGRVSAIVRSMREFAHPDHHEMQPADLNRALQSTLAVAQSEYKDWADLELTLGELPPVVCHLGEINQAVLNLVVNAAHALEDAAGAGAARGVLSVRTFCEGAMAVIAIGDTGPGIAAEIRDKVFDPFFTTKAVGRGTGQGLAIARTVVVDKHQGQLTFVTEPGKGTVFEIRLPILGRGGAASETPAALQIAG